MRAGGCEHAPIFVSRRLGFCLTNSPGLSDSCTKMSGCGSSGSLRAVVRFQPSFPALRNSVCSLLRLCFN